MSHFEKSPLGLQAKLPPGYRWMKIGEITRPGDKWWSWMGGQEWRTTHMGHRVGDSDDARDECPWIRPISSGEKALSQITWDCGGVRKRARTG